MRSSPNDHAPLRGCLGRDDEPVASPAGLFVPATCRPLVRGRAAGFEHGAENFVTELIAVVTQDACSLISGRIERDLEAIQRLKAFAFLTVVDNGKVARWRGVTAQHHLLRVA